jgi:hypothetical protein
MFAILSDHRGVAANRPHPGNAQVKFIILSHGKVSIEPANLVENAAAEEDRRDHLDEITPQQRFVV